MNIYNNPKLNTSLVRSPHSVVLVVCASSWREESYRVTGYRVLKFNSTFTRKDNSPEVHKLKKSQNISWFLFQTRKYNMV